MAVCIHRKADWVNVCMKSVIRCTWLQLTMSSQHVFGIVCTHKQKFIVIFVLPEIRGSEIETIHLLYNPLNVTAFEVRVIIKSHQRRLFSRQLDCFSIDSLCSDGRCMYDDSKTQSFAIFKL